MSEFPWDTKKDSKNESQGNMNSGSPFPPGLGATPKLPDILANAFAEAPMEEVKLDLSSPIGDGRVETPNIPSFLDTMHNMGHSLDSVHPPFGAVVSNSSNQMPPFMQESLAVPNGSEVMGHTISQNNQPVFDISFPPQKISTNSSKSSSNPASKATRKSPPPIFNPVFLDDGKQGTPETSLPNLKDSFLPPIASVGNNPFPPVAPVGNNSFSPVAPVSDSPFPQFAPVSDSPFPPVAPVSANPFPPIASVSANPFPPVAPVSDSPFPPFAAVSDNPFPPVAPVNDSPFPPSAAVNDSPFSPVASVGNNPFPPVAPVSDSPFPPVAPVIDSPFPPFTPVSGSPFPPVGGYDRFSSRSIASSIKVDDIARNLNGVGTALKSLFKSLTQGKSLIERMHDFQDDSSFAMGGSSNVSNTKSVNGNPFLDDAVPAQMSDNPFENNSPVINDVLDKSENSVMENQNVIDTGNSEKDAIRKITPIENPLFEIIDDYKIDDVIMPKDDDFSSISVGTFDNSIISHFPDIELNNASIPDANEGMSFEPGANILSSGRHMLDECGVPESTLVKSVSEEDVDFVRNISADVQEIKLRIELSESRYDDIEASVSILSNTASDLNTAFSANEKNIELLLNSNVNLDSFDSLGAKVDTIVGNISTLESALYMLKSDKDSLRSDISKIEVNISELVNSYTALLVQVHESSELSDSRISRIESSLGVLEQFETRFANIEHAQVESSSTSRELAKSISSMVDELGKKSSEMDLFKESSNEKSSELAKSIGSVTEYLDSELKKLGARSYKGFGQNVHLSNIVKNSGNMKLCMEWLEFLMGLVGRNNLSEILSYYEDLGWITEDVKMELVNYAEGIDFYMEKPDWKLTPNDHVKSIWFIENLAGIKVDKNRLSVIDRDIEKVKKGTDIYGI